MYDFFGESLPLARTMLLATPSNGLQAPARNARFSFTRFCKKNFQKTVIIFILFTLTGCTKKQSVNNSIPKSIVALSPSAVEILYSIGAENQISAVCEYCDYPPEAAEKPVAGGFDGKSFSLEKILSFQPDFLYLTDGMHNFLIPMLETLEIKYYLSKANSIESIKQEILEIGQITNHLSEAQKVVNQMEESISSVKTSSVSVYYEVWNNPFMSCGKNSFINDLIFTAGGTNLFSDLSEPYPQVSVETIIVRNPQIILITQSSGTTVESVKKRAGWQNIDAVKNNQIYIIDDNLSSRPSPRITESIKLLNSYISLAQN